LYGLFLLIINTITLFAVLDFAYYDLITRIKGIPCYMLYSKNLHSVPNSVTVFLENSIDETIAEANRIMQQMALILNYRKQVEYIQPN